MSGGDEKNASRQGRTVSRVRISRVRRTERQKEIVSWSFATKSNVFPDSADRCFLHLAPIRKIFCIFIHICLPILTVFPQKRGFFCGKMRTALRKKHFFCEQGRADLCAQTRTFFRNAGKNGLQDGFPPPFPPHFSLFLVRRRLVFKKQKESGTPRRLTRSAALSAQGRHDARTCQAKATFC